MQKNTDGRGAPGHFFIVPNEIVTTYAKRIGAASFVIYCCLKMHANKSSLAYPSISQLIVETGLARSALFRALDRLVAAGLIQRLKRSHYRVLNGDIFDHAESEKVPPAGRSNHEKVPTIEEKVPTIEEKVPTTGLAPVYEQDSRNKTQEQNGACVRFEFPALGSFERFWHSYPIKQAKLAARMAWDALCPSTQLVEEIVGAIKEQKTWRGWRAGYIPSPAKWLQEERWKDERPPEIGIETPEERVSRLRKELDARNGQVV